MSPDADAVQVLAQMNRNGRSRLMVVEQGELRGLVTLKDLMNFIALKMELEGESPGPMSVSDNRDQDQAAEQLRQAVPKQ